MYHGKYGVNREDLLKSREKKHVLYPCDIVHSLRAFTDMSIVYVHMIQYVGTHTTCLNKTTKQC